VAKGYSALEWSGFNPYLACQCSDLKFTTKCFRGIGPIGPCVSPRGIILYKMHLGGLSGVFCI